MFWKGRGRTEVAAVVVPFDADRPVVEAAKQDPGAFEQLYRKYVAQIYSLALYETRDPHAAEDITEGVFLKALAALPGFREQGEGEESTFRVWLYAIARNVISNQRRRDRRHPEDPIELALHLRARDDPAATAETRLEAQRALAAVMELPPERRQAVVLRFVNELSTREIGQIMGKSDGAVRVLIHRALVSVRRQLEP
ncbi:MAG: sigma-70 family RNA polymerase sigma factor [Chloroflexota bacterium]|nr:sigma-70 family RNA polymerase sigma factor [Chloroflexota bacterium]